MNRHGATVVGGGLKELVARSIFMCQNAEYQMRALSLGAATPLHPGETRLAGVISAMPTVVSRTWEYWSLRLAAAGALPPRRGAKKSVEEKSDEVGAKHATGDDAFGAVHAESVILSWRLEAARLALPGTWSLAP